MAKQKQYSYEPPHMAKQKQDDQLELTYSSYVKTQDVTLKTCRRRWMIGRSGERWSGISVLAARYDDDDENNFCHKPVPKNKEFTFMKKHSEKENYFAFYKTIPLFIEQPDI